MPSRQLLADILDNQAVWFRVWILDPTVLLKLLVQFVDDYSMFKVYFRAWFEKALCQGSLFLWTSF